MKLHICACLFMSCDLIYQSYLSNLHCYVSIELVSREKSVAEECDSLLENAAKTAMKLAAEPRSWKKRGEL